VAASESIFSNIFRGTISYCSRDVGVRVLNQLQQLRCGRCGCFPEVPKASRGIPTHTWIGIAQRPRQCRHHPHRVAWSQNWKAEAAVARTPWSASSSALSNRRPRHWLDLWVARRPSRDWPRRDSGQPHFPSPICWSILARSWHHSGKPVPHPRRRVDRSCRPSVKAANAGSAS